MKFEKILTAMLACAVALVTVTVSAFAAPEDSGSDAGTSADGSIDDDKPGESTDDPDDGDLVDDEKPAYVYTWNAPAPDSDESPWVSQNLTRTELIGTLDQEKVDVIVIKGASADDEIGAGFNTTLTGTKKEGYFQTNEDDENWPSNSITVKGSAIDWPNFYFQVFSNGGEATTVTLSAYTIADDDTSDSTPSESDSSTDSPDSSDSSDSDSSGGLIDSSNSNTNGSATTNKNPETGVAMTFVPAIIAGAVVIAAKKRK
ncbi:MAG: hypothetical protein K2N38_03415 [Oscillospiraceae bacterium]|nr:hypothetical protein [Oscillospiraceae bacterium]